jgi:hypothetical protein
MAGEVTVAGLTQRRGTRCPRLHGHSHPRCFASNVLGMLENMEDTSFRECKLAPAYQNEWLALHRGNSGEPSRSGKARDRDAYSSASVPDWYHTRLGNR